MAARRGIGFRRRTSLGGSRELGGGGREISLICSRRRQFAAADGAFALAPAFAG